MGKVVEGGVGDCQGDVESFVEVDDGEDECYNIVYFDDGWLMDVWKGMWRRIGLVCYLGFGCIERWLE